MYDQFYKFSAPAFGLNPDHRFFYGSKSHNKAMSYLRYGLQQGEGFIVITGNIGVGKSTLVKQLFAELDRRRIVAAQIATTNIDPDDAIRLILGAFNITPVSSDKAALLRGFEGFLIEQYKARRRVLLVVDEAQNLPLRTIEELRMLSNFTLDGHALFQSFLVGQPQFRLLMGNPDLEQLRQRVIASYHVEPMTPAETREYVEHRMRLVGWQNDPMITLGAFQRIHDETGGVPRRINLLCNRLLLLGAIEEFHELTEDSVEEVIADLRSEIVDSRLEPFARDLVQGTGAAPRAAGDAAISPAMTHGSMERIEQLERSVALHEETLRQLLTIASGLFGTLQFDAPQFNGSDPTSKSEERRPARRQAGGDVPSR